MAQIYRKKNDLLMRKIAGETLIVPIRGSLADMQSIFALNSVGEFIWENLDGEHSIEQIREAVEDAFDVSHETAGADVADFIRRLTEAGLIESA